MATEPTGAVAPLHAPIGRESFFRIRLTRDPDEAYAAVVRILAEHRARPDVALERCSPFVGGFGVESLALGDGEGDELLYVNVGDTYRATLCYVPGRGFFVSSWGDVYEAADRAHEEHTGERRCAYCSAWADAAEPCDSCGRNPSTGDPMPEPLRHVRLDTGHTLRTWDTGRTRGGSWRRNRLGYELRDPAGEVLFQGDDYCPSLAWADDSDEALRGLCGFLFLRPGDTDAEYFAGYSDRQRAFAESDACERLAFLYSDDPSNVGSDAAGSFVEVDAEDEGRADA